METEIVDPNLVRSKLAETDQFETQDIALRLATVTVEDDPSGDAIATMIVEGDPYPIAEHAMKQLATACGIPTGYLLKCPAEIQAVNLDYWQRKLSDRKRATVVVGQGQVQAITSPNFHPVPNTHLFDALIEAVGRGDPARVFIDSFEHDWKVTRLAVTNRDASHTVVDSVVRDLDSPRAAEGDIVRAGASLVNSLVNDVHTELQPFAFRLVCLNRLCTPILGSTNGKVYRYKNDGAKLSKDWISDSMDEIAGKFTELFQQIDKAAATKLSNVQEVVDEIQGFESICSFTIEDREPAVKLCFHSQ